MNGTRYFLAENGEAVGPFTVEQLRAMFATGRVHAGSQVCREGAEEWETAEGLGLHKASVPPPLPEEARGHGPSNKSLGCMALAAVVVMAVLVIIPAIGGRAGNDSTLDVRATAQEMVRQSLKSPSTAVFSGKSETEVLQGVKGVYTVNGWVDAHNEFGAVVRRRYGVRILQPDGKQFEPDLLSIDGKVVWEAGNNAMEERRAAALSSAEDTGKTYGVLEGSAWARAGHDMPAEVEINNRTDKSAARELANATAEELERFRSGYHEGFKAAYDDVRTAVLRGELKPSAR